MESAELTFTLENFEGPLDFLWALIQKSEIDIYEIRLKAITDQYLQAIRECAELDLEVGAEFIGTAAYLVWLKSRELLPKHEQEQLTAEEQEDDPRFEIIHSLMDYSRFKEAGKDLAERETQQNAFYARGIVGGESQKNLGIEHLSLEDLALLFKQALAKSATSRGHLHEEVWKVSDKISDLQSLLMAERQIPFELIFSGEKNREELIVLFLAVLELMKMGEVKVVRNLQTSQVLIIGTYGERN